MAKIIQPAGGRAETRSWKFSSFWSIQFLVHSDPDTGSWGLSCLFQQYVKAKCPRAALPPNYALELLTIYAWEMGTQENENFRLDKGFTTVMELLQEYKFLCIYWTKYYTFQNPVIKDFVRKQLKRDRYWAPCVRYISQRTERPEAKAVLHLMGGLYQVVELYRHLRPTRDPS